MRKVLGWVVRAKGLVGKAAKDRELDAELQSHLQLHIDDNVRAGLTEQEARRQALIKLGGLDAAKEACRAQRGLPWAEKVGRDVSYATRSLWKSPGFTLVGVLTLGLGVGANTAMFTVLDGLVLKPLPWPDSKRVLSIWEGSPGKGHGKTPVAAAQFLDLRTGAKSFQAMAGWNATAINLASGGTPERYQGAAVTEDFFRVVGIGPRLGTGFAGTQFSAGQDGVVLLGDGVWRDRFGGRSDIVGRTIQINGRARTVVGVMPPGFQTPAKAQFWVPRIIKPFEREDRDYKSLMVLGRLADGASPAGAESELRTIFAGLRQQFPDVLTGWDVSAHLALEDVAGPLRPTLFTLSAAVGTVLLLACLNLANLSLARGLKRQGALSVQAALGAGRQALFRQLLVESLFLTCAGGLFGWFMAHGLLAALLALAPPSLPRLDQVRLDGTAFLFTAAACGWTALIFGLAPAWRLSRVSPLDALREAGQRATAPVGLLRQALVVVQVGAAVAVLIATGLLLRSFDRLLRLDLGFNPTNLMTVRLELPPAKYGAGEKRDLFAEEVVRRLTQLPGIESAAATTLLPLQGWPQFIMRLEENPDIQVSQAPATGYQGVTLNYFRTMGIPLIRGRAFAEDDREDAPLVAVVNQTFARRFFPNRDPIGQRFEVGFADPPNWLEIVGVAGDSKGPGLEAQPALQVFVPLRQQARFLRDNPTLSLAVRSQAAAPRLAEVIRQAVWAIDKDQPLHLLKSMSEVVADQTAPRRFTVTVLAVFAGAAVFLAMLGLYGVMSSGVSARTRELGIRLALGASHRSVLRLVLRQGVQLTGAGLILGIGGALAATRLLQSLLFEVKPLDPLTFASVPTLLAAVALLACWLPARRASRINPMVALRYE